MALFGGPYDLLLGRKTYEIFAAYWPYQDADNPIAKSFNAVTKYVATRSDRPLSWDRSVALHDAAADVARLKGEDGPDLVTQGSGNLLRTLLAHDLVDEFRLFVFPVVLGRGKRLFGEESRPGGLKLVEGKVSPGGIFIGTYRRDGAVKTGTFATRPPSEAELERRDRWRREG